MPDQLDDHPMRVTSSPPPPRIVASTAMAVAAIAIGAILLFVGYWGASDTSSPGEQIPHLASATVPGLALVIGGTVLVLRREHERDREELRALTARFDALLDWLERGDEVTGTEAAHLNSSAASTSEVREG